MKSEQLRAETLALIGTGITAAHIAREIGTKPQNINAFLKKGTLGPEKKKSLETYLKTHGAKETVDLPDFCSVLADELLALSILLRSDIPCECKALQFRSRIESYVSCLPDYTRALNTPVASHTNPPVLQAPVSKKHAQ